MYSGLRSQRAPGMQVHAVPEAERAIDSTGRRLPWGYEYSSSHNLTAEPSSERREPTERGPFGKSMRRTGSRASRSRSKTAEPRKEEDRIKADNIAAEDAVFGSLRRTQSGVGERDVLGEVDPNADAAAGRALQATAATAESDSEPSEVLLYGFGDDLQWAAIDFYERASNGYVLEDYDRAPAGARFDVSKTLGRQAVQRSLSRAAMKKKNKYAGGNHWIKVTFESRQAAELAIARSPHTIKGYLVYAEPYQGQGPQTDAPIRATQAGAQLTSEVLPPTLSTTPFGNGGSPNGSSTTATSATATQPGIAPSSLRRAQQPPPWGLPRASSQQDSPASSSTLDGPRHAHEPAVRSPLSAPQSTGIELEPLGQTNQLKPRKIHVQGAKQITLLPAELALAPKPAKASWSAWLGTSEIIGAAVPRREDGTFDFDRASLYWRFFYWIDSVFGTDFCGLKSED